MAKGKTAPLAVMHAGRDDIGKIEITGKLEQAAALLDTAEKGLERATDMIGDASDEELAGTMKKRAARAVGLARKALEVADRAVIMLGG